MTRATGRPYRHVLELLADALDASEATMRLSPRPSPGAPVWGRRAHGGPAGPSPQGAGGRRRDGALPARAKPRARESATDGKASGARAPPGVPPRDPTDRPPKGVRRRVEGTPDGHDAVTLP